MRFKRLRKRFRPKPLTPRRRLSLAAVAAIPILAIFMFGNRGILSRVRLEMDRTDALEQLRAERAVSDSLHVEIARHRNDRTTIEHLARERFGMVSPGETIYRVDE